MGGGTYETLYGAVVKHRIDPVEQRLYELRVRHCGWWVIVAATHFDAPYPARVIVLFGLGSITDPP